MLMHQLLSDAAERAPDKLAFCWVDRKKTLTYAQAVAAMERMAGALHDCGVRRGDRVGVFAHNGMDYLLAMLGAWRIGAIAALVNIKFADELEYYWADHEPKVAIYTHDMRDVVMRAQRAVRAVQTLICMDGPQEGALSLPDLMNAGFPAPPDPRDENAIAHLSYTSGTTGKPKGACLAHEPTVRASRCIAERLQLRAHDVSFGPTALSSSYQLVGNLLPPLAAGCSINVMGRWTQPAGWGAIDATQATVLVGNPTLLDEVLRESDARGRSPGRLRMALTGGAPLPPTLKAAWRDRLRLPIVESYGQSELGGFVALGYPELVPQGADLTRIGPPLPDKEVRIFGANDETLPVGEVGDIVLRGGFLWGYWGNPDKTREATRGGWLRTGDLGVIDQDGFITLRSRRAELIVVDGISWYPRDVEEALCEQPGVRQAALIGLGNAGGDQKPVVFVTMLDGASFDGAALKKSIAVRLSYDLSPLSIRAVDTLPMTPTGKISKGDLQAMVAAGTLA
jgi:long-chain acyl-CoA synthetase